MCLQQILTIVDPRNGDKATGAPDLPSFIVTNPQVAGKTTCIPCVREKDPF